MDIDYANLSLQDALDIAILIEADAQERYGELADQLDLHNTPEAAQFFRHMVVNEGKHAEALRVQRQEKFGDAPSKIDPTIVPEIEAPDYDAVRAFMTEHQALRIAMACETRAENFYARALDKVTDSDVKALFSEMREEEVHHQEMVQKVISKLPPEETVNPNDFADEPVSQ